MMSRVKNFKIIALCALFFVALTSCKDKEQPVDPFVTPGNVENPNWVISDNDMNASMTAIVKVSFASQPGTLAAFIGNECCGIGEYKTEYGLYWLYISTSEEAGGDVQLRFYSPELKRIFDATETFHFSNNTHFGTTAAPYTPSWNVAQ